jgi:hypothetical protein
MSKFQVMSKLQVTSKVQSMSKLQSMSNLGTHTLSNVELKVPTQMPDCIA